jgi:hypothetical protein
MIDYRSDDIMKVLIICKNFRRNNMDLHSIIVPLGILTYSCLMITLLSGLFHWQLKFHKFFAITTIVLATTHMLIVILT